MGDINKPKIKKYFHIYKVLNWGPSILNCVAIYDYFTIISRIVSLGEFNSINEWLEKYNFKGYDFVLCFSCFIILVENKYFWGWNLFSLNCYKFFEHLHYVYARFKCKFFNIWINYFLTICLNRSCNLFMTHEKVIFLILL